MTADILFEVKGCAGVITLNKQQSLNAVTDEMLSAISAHMDIWGDEERIKRVIIKAAPGRAFSAGGDIRHLYECGIAQNYDYDFFAREYALNARIAGWHKPYIALIDGIVMGGGVGVSCHGSHVVAGENIAFAMPEVGIGFFPDVGGSYLLSRMPGYIGLYLGLTGERLKQADCAMTGLATHTVSSDGMAALEEALCTNADVDQTLADHDFNAGEGRLLNHMDAINLAFSASSVGEIMGRLESMMHSEGPQGAWAEKTIETLQTKSPTSLEIAFRQITRGKDLSMADCMRMEYRILKRILGGGEFYEGIRAAIIDKDGAPKWQPSELSDVDESEIERHFDDLGSEELVL